MNKASLSGVRITRGPSDWQILQRRLDGTADIPLSGTWCDPNERLARVEVRVVDESTQAPVTVALDWNEADVNPDRTWRHVLEKVPAGGPYRVETRLKVESDSWRLAGDHIRHLGVGDLWLVAGDDNALGFGHGPAFDPPEPGIHLFGRNERWTMASHPLHDSTGVRNNRFFSSGAAAHSPWLAFARTVRHATGLPIGLIPAAQEGTLLESWHNRRKGMPSPSFDTLLAMLKLATSYYDFANFSLLDGGPCVLPKPDYPAGLVAGCLWSHGNADCRREGAAKSYGATLVEFIAKLRAALDAPHLPVIVCQVNRVIGVAKPGESALWGMVRDGQRTASLELRKVAVLPTLDAALSDGIHNSAAGNVMIGERAGRAALGMVYAKPLPWRAPDFGDAWFDEGERNKVVIEFSNVSGELRPVAGEVSSLTIADAAGGAPIRKVRLVGPNRILALLNRELGESPTVSFCAGHNPPLAFVDDNNCPPLAFASVAIRED